MLKLRLSSIKAIITDYQPFLFISVLQIMRFFIGLILWFILLTLCWPLALLVFFIWLILLPFQLLGFAIGGIFKLVTAILMFPFRVAGMTAKR